MPRSSSLRARRRGAVERTRRHELTSISSAGVIVTSLAALLAAASAWAESPQGLYVGGGIGSSNVMVESNAGDLFTHYIEGQDDSMAELHVGYRVLRHLGAELAYFGAQPGWDTLAYEPVQREAYRNIAALDVRTTEVSVVGVLPFGRMWEAYARGGIAFWHGNADQTVIRLRNGAVAMRSISNSGDEFVFGLGVGASPTPAWHVRFEFQSFEVDREFVHATTPTTLDTFLVLFDYHLGAKGRATGE